jgi:type I restriction enzyme, S subunit
MIVTTLRNKINVKHGFPFKGEFFSSCGEYIILTPGNFNESGGFKFDLNKAKFYTGEIPVDYICLKGDLIVAMTEQAEGLLGASAIVPQDNRYLHNQRIGLVTVDENEIDKMFLYHLFNTESVRQQIRRSSSGTKVKHTSPERIYDVIVKLPSLKTQQKIAALLSSLETKIELNNSMNAELEAMAKTLYDYWFVQFDFPDENGKPYKSSGGKMVYNETLKREIPEGWEVKKIEELLDKNPQTKRIEAKEYLSNGKYPVIDQSTDFIAGFTNDDASVIKGSTYPQIVFGDHTRILKFINFDFARGADGTQILKSKIRNVPQHLFYFSIRKIDLSNYGYARHFKFLKDQLISVPKLEIATAFERTGQLIFNTILVNQKQNLELANLRDWLLPMLMNGQVSVGEAYGQAEEALSMAAETTQVYRAIN